MTSGQLLDPDACLLPAACCPAGGASHRDAVSGPCCWLGCGAVLTLGVLAAAAVSPEQGTKHMFQSDGLRGMFKGNGLNCIRIIPNQGEAWLATCAAGLPVLLRQASCRVLPVPLLVPVLLLWPVPAVLPPAVPSAADPLTWVPHPRPHLNPHPNPHLNPHLNPCSHQVHDVRAAEPQDLTPPHR